MLTICSKIRKGHHSYLGAGATRETWGTSSTNRTLCRRMHVLFSEVSNSTVDSMSVSYWVLCSSWSRYQITAHHSFDQYSQQGHQVQHCHQHHEHQQHQQDQHDLSHRVNHELPKDRPKEYRWEKKRLKINQWKSNEVVVSLTACPGLPAAPRAPVSP